MFISVKLVYCSAAKYATEWKEKKGDQGLKTIHTTRPYQRLGWSLDPLSSSTSCRSAYASGIHSLNHLQCESYLHLPVVGLTALISATRTVWGEISLIHTPAPQGNSGRYGYSANCCDRGRGGQYGLPQMAVSEFSQAQIGPLPLFAGNRSRPWSTSYQLRFWWHMQAWGYVWFLIFANSDRVVLDSANFTVLPSRNVGLEYLDIMQLNSF